MAGSLQSDHLAIQAVLAGNTAHFAAIVERHEASVRRIVSRGLGRGIDREEVIQETWCRAYRQLARLDDPGRLGPWLGRIARNCVTDHFRRRKVDARTGPLTHDPAAAECSVDWVWDLVDQLDGHQAELVRWRYRDRESYADMASRLGVQPSTVRGRLYEARCALRRLLELRGY